MNEKQTGWPVDTLMLKYLDGRLSADELAELENLIANSPESLQEYAKVATLESLLYDQFGQNSDTPTKTGKPTLPALPYSADASASHTPIP